MTNLISAPRTPQRANAAAFFCASRSFPKEGGHVRQIPWISASRALKSLKLEQKLIAGYPEISTGCPVFSTGLAISSTGLFSRSRGSISLYLSLLKEERREKEGVIGGEGNPRVERAAYFLIHGLAPSSTGNPWISVEGKALFSKLISKITGPSTHPRFVLRVGSLSLPWKGAVWN